MAIKTFYATLGQDGNFGAMVDGVAQTAASRSDGWTVAKSAAGLSSEFDAGTKQSGTFSSQSTTPKPASFLTGTTANAFKTPTPLSGTLANALWTFNLGIIATTASSQAGRLRLRIFKSANASGAGAVELTPGAQVGTTVTVTTASFLFSQVSWSPGTTFTLNNEYLFFVIAWEITTASGSNSGDVVLRVGSSSGTNIQTPDFATVPNTPIQLDATMTLTPAMTKREVLARSLAVSSVLTPTMNRLALRSRALAVTGVFTPSLLKKLNAFIALALGGGGGVGLLDDFNRADGPLGPNWTPALSTLEPEPVISGNRIVGSGNNNSSGYWNKAMFGPDSEVSMGVAPSVSGEHDPIIRATSFNPSQVPNDGYLLQTFASQVNLFRANGSGGLIGIGSVSGLSPFNGVRLTAIGNVITAYVRLGGIWVQQIQVTDTTWPGAGYIGFLMGQDAAAYIDDFSGGTIGGGGVGAVFTPTMSFGKSRGVSLPGSVVLAPAFSRLARFSRTFVALVALSPALTRQAFLNRTFAVASTLTAAMVRKLNAFRALPVAATMVPGFSKNFMAFRSMSVNVSLVSDLQKFVTVGQKNTPISLNVTMTMAPGMSRGFFKQIAIPLPATLTPVLARRLLAQRAFPVSTILTPTMTTRSLRARLLSAPATFLTGMTKGVRESKTFNATTTISPGMDVLGGRSVFFNAFTSLVPTMSKLTKLGRAFSGAISFVPGMQRNSTRGLALVVTLTPAQGKQSHLWRVFASVATIQVGLQTARQRSISLSVPVPFAVVMLNRRVQRVLFSVGTVFDAVLSFLRFSKPREPIDILFSTAVDPAELWSATDAQETELETVFFEATNVDLDSVSSEIPELGGAGEEIPGLRSVS
jgi:hypothetical protein